MVESMAVWGGWGGAVVGDRRRSGRLEVKGERCGF